MARGYTIIVESKKLGLKHYLADNQYLVNAYCPIDGAQLVSENNYDYHGYRCQICHSLYSSTTDVNKLERQARMFVKEYRQTADKLREKLSWLEKLLSVTDEKLIK